MISTTTIKSQVAKEPGRITLFKGSFWKNIVKEIVLNIEAAETPPAVFNVYTALMSQDTISTTSGLLVIGKKYLILSLDPTDDFENTGFVSEGTIWTASATTPTVWTEGTVVFNVTDSVQVANVLKNSVGVVTLAYAGVGTYEINSTALFTADFTAFPTQFGLLSEDATKTFKLTWVSPSKIKIETFEDGVLTDNLLDDTLIEFRVYPD